MIPVFAWERAVQGWVARVSRPLLVPLTALNVLLGGQEPVPAMLPMFIVAPYFLGPRKLVGLATGLIVAVALLVTPTVEDTLKRLLHRGRPRDEQEWGIPSGDCAYVTIWSVGLLPGWYPLLPIAIVMWARMARDAHWPLDTVAGMLLGLWLVSPVLVL